MKVDIHTLAPRNKASIKVATLVFLGWILVFSQLTAVVFALSSDQKRLFDSGVRYYDLDYCGDAAADGGPLYGPRFPRTENADDLVSRIRTYIRDTRPDSPLIAYAATFVQIGQREDVNPAMVVAMAQKETSLGTAGFGTPSGGYNITNLRPGGSFARYGSYNEGIQATYDNLTGGLYLGPPSNFTTIAQIIRRWAPPTDGNDTTGYIRFVRDAIRKMLQGSPLEEGVEDVPACGAGSGDTGVVNPQGYSFPVAPQRKSQNSGVPAMSPLPCSGNCHHDGTIAFDISRRPGGNVAAGTPVYAIGDGRIDLLHLYNGIPGCYSLQLHSTKDNAWYWYGHIQNPSVRNLQRVQAGQQIAEIGVSACTGNGSSPHLHIDRGCSINGVPQKGGRQECRDPSFRPFMNNLFNSLPE